jgi:DNA processing protein
MESLELWLRLANLQLPARAANALIEQFGGPEAVFSATRRQLEDDGGATEAQAARILDPTFIPTGEQLRFLETRGVRVIPRGADDYPRNLRNIPDPPAVLFVRGRLDEKDRFGVALVGSRRATPYGRSVTAKLARELTQAGITVLSGGALGIDTVAHQATADAGGRTYAVLGCGLDVEYPRDNQRLFERIVEEDRGALLSEFPLGAAPEPWRFPMRNRIISGLSMGVVVVEAGLQSGALLTATIAAEQGRDVLAVPGNVDREGSRGTNALIKDGAILVEDAQDVLRALGVLVLEPPPVAVAAAPAARSLPDAQKRILEHLSLTPKHIDALAADVRLGSNDISVQITLLELSGMVRRLPGNCFIRVL